MSVPGSGYVTHYADRCSIQSSLMAMLFIFSIAAGIPPRRVRKLTWSAAVIWGRGGRGASWS